MWCKVCQRDVPAIASGDDAKLRCLRCSGNGPVDSSAQAAGTTSQVESGDLDDATPLYDGWELEQRLAHIRRVLQPGTTAPAEEPRDESRLRLDAAHSGPSGWHVSAPSRQGIRQGKRPAVATVRRRSLGEWIVGFLIWSGLGLGVMFLACGGLLLLWSFLSARHELWTIGLPIAIVGQISLVVGLALQIDRLWNHHRKQAAKLDTVGEQLHDLKSATALLSTTHSSPAAAFYSHFASGASPHVLLTDLKSQLDLLAVKLGQMDRY